MGRIVASLYVFVCRHYQWLFSSVSRHWLQNLLCFAVGYLTFVGNITAFYLPAAFDCCLLRVAGFQGFIYFTFVVVSTA